MTILNQEAICEPNIWGYVAGVSLLLFVAFLIMAILFAFSENKISASILFVSAITSAFIAMVSLCFSKNIPTGKYKYEVVLDDDINFKDMYEKYKVVEQRGNIWVLEDKEVSE